MPAVRDFFRAAQPPKGSFGNQRRARRPDRYFTTNANFEKDSIKKDSIKKDSCGDPPLVNLTGPMACRLCFAATGIGLHKVAFHFVPR